MVTVAPAESANAEALAGLAEEMVRFYGAAEVDPLERRISQISENLFADPSAYSLLAWDNGRLVGFAAYSSSGLRSVSRARCISRSCTSPRRHGERASDRF